MQDNARITPLRIDANRGAGTLRIEWADGHETLYDATTLRWLCPCAYCRGEAGMPGWLDSNPTLTPDQTKLVHMALVGSYAVQATWGDGHDSGFHTYLLLRDRCPCDACERERARRAADAADHGGHAGHGDHTDHTGHNHGGAR
jgi:DUF971 family protein